MQLDPGEVKKSVRFRKEATVIGFQVVENPHKCRISLGKGAKKKEEKN